MIAKDFKKEKSKMCKNDMNDRYKKRIEIYIINDNDIPLHKYYSIL